MEILREIKKLNLNENEYYEGEVNSNNLPDGKGKLTCNGTRWYEQYVYEGEFKDGKKHGKGILKYKEKRNDKGEPVSYEGEWKEDMRDGYGKENGRSKTYEGGWKKDLRDGYGILANEYLSYEGEWKEDKCHGKGILKMSNGTIYEGNIFNKIEGWSLSKIKGHGRITYPNGEIYEGDLEGKTDTFEAEIIRSGHGIMTYQDGHVFDGVWLKDNPIDEAAWLQTAEFTPELIKDFCYEKDEWENSHMDWDDQVGYWKAGFKIDDEIRGFTWRCDWEINGYSGSEWRRYTCGIHPICSIVIGSNWITESEYMLPGLLERDEKGRIIFCGVHKDGVRHGLGSEFSYNDVNRITELQGLWQNGTLTHKRSGDTLIPVE